MGLFNRLERRLSPLAIPNITLYVVVLQALALILARSRPESLEKMLFIPDFVLQGEYWRIVTFALVPPTLNPFWAFFHFYLLYLMGTALENYWGTFRYNLFLLVGALASMGAAFIVPGSAATNVVIGGSVFLAFALLYPDFQLLLFFLIPVRIKWLALVAWLMYGWSFVSGDWMARVLIVAAVANFLLFFGKEIFLRMRSANRRMIRRAQTVQPQDRPFHVCTVCGIDDRADRRMEFRYCPQCAGSPCYCINHINDHTHISAPAKVEV